MTHSETEFIEPLQELELVFALPDHRNLTPNRNPVITNFRPDYFGAEEYARLIAGTEVVETELGTYRKKYDLHVGSRRIGEFVDRASPSMIPSLLAHLVIYERI